MALTPVPRRAQPGQRHAAVPAADGRRVPGRRPRPGPDLGRPRLAPCINYFFTPPFHTLTINETNNTLALLVFVLVATLVSSTVDLAARRTRQAARAAAESRTLANLAGSVLGGEEALTEMLDRVRETFALSSVTLLERTDDGWTTVASAGPAVTRPDEADTEVPTGDRLTLALCGSCPAGRGPAPDRRLRGPGGGRARPHPAQPGRRRGGPARGGRQGAGRPAGRRRARLPHPARGRQGVRLHAAERRPRPRRRRPTDPPPGRGRVRWTGWRPWSTTCST